MYQDNSIIVLLIQNHGAKGGFDMNVAEVWSQGITGKGVVIAILDNGIWTEHPDLKRNYVSLLLKDSASN